IIDAVLGDEIRSIELPGSICANQTRITGGDAVINPCCGELVPSHQKVPERQWQEACGPKEVDKGFGGSEFIVELELQFPGFEVLAQVAKSIFALCGIQTLDEFPKLADANGIVIPV